jgi:hypothetical protein
MRKVKSNPESAKLKQAKTFLVNLLGDGPVEAAEVAEAARMSRISEATLRRAKDVLSVCSQRVGGSWVWTLPKVQDAQGAHREGREDHQDAHQGTHHVAQDEHDARQGEEKRMRKPKKHPKEHQIFVYSEADGGMITYEVLRRRKGYYVEERP